jgi:MazG family protein
MDEKNNHLKSFERLVNIMKKLLSPGGCPWDREQSHDSLKPYIIEESYEVCDAIDRGDYDNLKEELGDVALQIVFHAELARRAGLFDISDVLNGISDKMVNRHPHVFGDLKVKDSKEVLANWEEIKKKEKSRKRKIPASILDGMPKNMPALATAWRIQERASNVGFDWEKPEQVWEKVQEELEEFSVASREKKQEDMEEEFGDLLFSLVNLSRFIDINPEHALRKTILKFDQRFRHVERRAEENGQNLGDMTLAEMDEYWNEAKDKNKIKND